jgi:hypothetical protein
VAADDFASGERDADAGDAVFKAGNPEGVRCSLGDCAVAVAIDLVGYFLPLIMAVLAVPMVLGKVPPNRIYGLRTPKTLSPPSIWYQANRVGGWYMLAAAAVTICFNVVLMAMHPEWPSQTVILWMAGAAVASVILASVFSLVYVHKL